VVSFGRRGLVLRSTKRASCLRWNRFSALTAILERASNTSRRRAPRQEGKTWQQSAEGLNGFAPRRRMPRAEREGQTLDSQRDACIGHSLYRIDAEHMRSQASRYTGGPLFIRKLSRSIACVNCAKSSAKGESSLESMSVVISSKSCVVFLIRALESASSTE
jgi:hypothetical protein